MCFWFVVTTKAGPRKPLRLTIYVYVISPLEVFFSRLNRRHGWSLIRPAEVTKLHRGFQPTKKPTGGSNLFRKQ